MKIIRPEEVKNSISLNLLQFYQNQYPIKLLLIFTSNSYLILIKL